MLHIMLHFFYLCNCFKTSKVSNDKIFVISVLYSYKIYVLGSKTSAKVCSFIISLLQFYYLYYTITQELRDAKIAKIMLIEIKDDHFTLSQVLIISR